MSEEESIRVRLVRPETLSTPSEGGPGDTGHIDMLVLQRVSAMLPAAGGMVPARPRLLRVLWQQEDYPGDAEVTASLWRLVARGDLQPCLRGELLHVTTPARWLEGRPEQEEARALSATEMAAHLTPEKAAGAVVPRPTGAVDSTMAADGSAGASSADDKELFDLQVALDVEVERALLYRVAVVLEVIYGLVLVRQAVMAWLGHW